jgi:hypothetical protein
MSRALTSVVAQTTLTDGRSATAALDAGWL